MHNSTTENHSSPFSIADARFSHIIAQGGKWGEGSKVRGEPPARWHLYMRH